MTPEAEVRNHIHYKETIERSLKPELAARMRALLDDGAEPVYWKLRHEAQWVPAGEHLWHVAPRSARDSIAATGLRASQPAEGNYAGVLEEEWVRCTGQPAGVYLAPSREAAHVFTLWAEWDLWRVDVAGLDLARDELNPGCWIVLGDIEQHRVALHEET